MGIIYVIKNDINKKLYVGKTITTLSNRWLHHKDAYLREDWHLYRAMRKYGIEHFWIEELENCSDAEVNEREVYWINKLNTFYNGYNMTIGGEGRTSLDRNKIIDLWNKGYSTSQIANIIGNKWPNSIIEVLKQQKIYDAEEIKRRKIIEIANKQSEKNIIQYNDKSEVVNIFKSMKEAEEKTGINRKNIKTALNTGVGAGGFLWRREGEDPPTPHAIKTRKIRKVRQIDLKTNETIAIFKNATEAAKVNKTNPSSITAVCRGERTKHHGFKWEYIE